MCMKELTSESMQELMPASMKELRPLGKKLTVSVNMKKLAPASLMRLTVKYSLLQEEKLHPKNQFCC